MSIMIAKVSYVAEFSGETVMQYKQIAGIAQEVQSSMGRMVEFVENEKYTLEKQIRQLLQISDTLREKLNKIWEWVQDAKAEVDDYYNAYCSADYEDRGYWHERLEEARIRHNNLVNDYEYARQLQRTIEQRQQQCDHLHRAVLQMINAMQKNVYEVEKIIAALHEETNYNGRALSDLVNRLQQYCAAPSLGMASVGGSGAVCSSGDSAGSTKIHKKKTAYKLNKNAFGYDSEGKRHTYKLYIPQAQPIKQMLYDIMQGLHTNVRDAIMKELECVEFLSARHGFVYGSSQRGKRLHIIGVDISDPSFNTLLLLHAGHHLYENNKAKERIAFDNCVGYDIKRNLKIADSKIRKMAMDFTPVDSVKQYAKSTDFRFKSAGSQFFSQCFKAYVSEDYEFLKVVKEHFGDSYNAFLEIITKLPNR